MFGNDFASLQLSGILMLVTKQRGFKAGLCDKCATLPPFLLITDEALMSASVRLTS